MIVRNTNWIGKYERKLHIVPVRHSDQRSYLIYVPRIVPWHGVPLLYPFGDHIYCMVNPPICWAGPQSPHCMLPCFDPLDGHLFAPCICSFVWAVAPDINLLVKRLRVVIYKWTCFFIGSTRQTWHPQIVNIVLLILGTSARRPIWNSTMAGDLLAF